MPAAAPSRWPSSAWRGAVLPHSARPGRRTGRAHRSVREGRRRRGGRPAPPPPPASSAGGAVTWQRADLGFVSAYVLARAGEAAIVDTGLPGSEGTIHEALMAAGLDWKDVGHVILTHRHGDHVCSVDAILAAAS